LVNDQKFTDKLTAAESNNHFQVTNFYMISLVFGQKNEKPRTLGGCTIGNFYLTFLNLRSCKL